ncbi:site-specific integrase, partial [Tropicibacter alexandrii]|uniref:site-specific integrase n=1 Tax=Tropicibacter alexandrii TaxID=2267683 RepID=UPI0013E8D1DD
VSVPWFVSFAAINAIKGAASNRDTSKPTFEELWHFYKREKKPTLSLGRQRRLDELYKLYFKPMLAKVPASQLPDAIRAMRDRMIGDEVKKIPPWLGDNRDEKQGARTEPLSRNTIKDIVDIAAATLNFLIDERIVVGPSPVPAIRVPGTTAPIDRTPKGRHLTFEEIGKLIHACKCRHHLHMMLLELGCASRSGVFTQMRIDQVLWDFDAIDTLPSGQLQTRKVKPVIPVTGPMFWVVPEAVSSAGPDLHLIHYRSQGLTGRNGTQIIHRIAKRALGEEKAKRVNWYSFRHTLIDWLEMRVPARSLSMAVGHISVFDSKERRQFRQNDGSRTTLIYLRRSSRISTRFGKHLKKNGGQKYRSIAQSTFDWTTQRSKMNGRQQQHWEKVDAGQVQVFCKLLKRNT